MKVLESTLLVGVNIFMAMFENCESLSGKMKYMQTQ